MSKKKNASYDIEKMKSNLKKNIIVEDAGDYNSRVVPQYAAAVNLRRYIRDIKDGLIPVHRRVLMAMYKEGLKPGKSKKSATVVGMTLAQYHPHGEAAVYQSLVYMSQPWRHNAPLVSIDGNNGSAYSPESYGAQRYTDTGLSEFAWDCFFKDWKVTKAENDMTVDWIPNFDESGYEPMYLPAKYPVFLLNGFRAMGPGRYTSMPSFNLAEIFEVVIQLMDDPDAKIKVYPDDPRGCMIINKYELENMLDEEVKIKYRATYEVETFRGKDIIKITSVPFEVNPDTVIDAIKKLAVDGLLPEISDLAGSSEDVNGVGDGFSIQIEMRKGYDAHQVMQKLYKRTSLETAFVTKYAFVDGFQSVDYTLRTAILAWIHYRRETIKRIAKIERNEILKRAHFLIPLIKIIESGEIDKFIKLTRKHDGDDEALIKKLMEAFDITDYQADRISGVTIKQLQVKHLKKYKEELAEISKRLDEINLFIKDKKAINKKIKSELREAIKKYGVKRKSKVIQLMDRDMVPDIYHWLIFTDKYVKKLPYDDNGYKIGRIEFGDKVIKAMGVNNKDWITIFSNDGKATSIQVNDIPNSSIQSGGIALTQIGVNGNFVNAIKLENDNRDSFIVSITAAGTISKTPVDDLYVDKKKTMPFMKLAKNDFMIDAKLCNDSDDIMVYTEKGKALRIKQVKVTSRNTKGSGSIKLDDGDTIKGVALIKEDDTHILIVTNRGHMKKLLIKHIPKKKSLSEAVEIVSGGSVAKVVPLNESVEVLYGYTTAGVFDFDPAAIKPSTRVGPLKRIIELKSTEYLFDLA